jgi:hypothetical protein
MHGEIRRAARYTRMLFRRIHFKLTTTMALFMSSPPAVSFVLVRDPSVSGI